MGDIPAPFDAYRDVVRPEWIDDNRHMNMGYYVVVFDLATDEWMRFVGLDRAHRRAREVTTFCLETHVTYHQEVRERDPLRFTTRLLDFDAKRIHYIHQMYHGESGYLAATNEVMSLHVSQATRRSAPCRGRNGVVERMSPTWAVSRSSPRRLGADFGDCAGGACSVATGRFMIRPGRAISAFAGRPASSAFVSTPIAEASVSARTCSR